MAFKGTLHEFSPMQLLNLVTLARRTGMFTIRTPADTAHLYFKDGRLTHASLIGEKCHLAMILLHAGKLSADQVRIITTQPEVCTDKRLARLLVNANCLTQDEIVGSVKRYMLDLVSKVLEWHEGDFEFTPGASPSDDRITIPINLESVILENSRRLQETERLQSELPDLNAFTLRFTPEFDDRMGSANLSVDEWRVSSSVGSGSTIKQIAETNAMDDFRVRKAVAGLVQAGLVELVSPKGVPLPAASAGGRQGDEGSPATRGGAFPWRFGRGKRAG